MDNISHEYNNRFTKFNVALGSTLLWCLGIFLVSIGYDFLITGLMKCGFLVQKNVVEYSTPIFYIESLMYIGMILHILKKLEIFTELFIFRHIRKSRVKNLIKYGLIGFLYGIMCDFCIFALFFFIIGFQYGLSLLAMHKRYGDEWIGGIAIIILILGFLSFALAGIKEGIRYGSQNSQ